MNDEHTKHQDGPLIDCRKILGDKAVIISASTASESYRALMREKMGGMADDISFAIAYREELKAAHDAKFPDYEFSHETNDFKEKKGSAAEKLFEGVPYVE
jgi:hypothetical protein